MSLPNRISSVSLSTLSYLYSKVPLGIRVCRLQQYLENRVGTTTFCVHGCLPDKTIFFSPLHQLQTIQIVGDCVLGESLDKNAVNFGLMQIQCFRFRKILHLTNNTCSKS